MQTIDSYTASNLLHDGEIIIYPTESIYGIGCDPWNESSVNKIYEIKNRPSNKPMIIVGSDIAQIEKLVDCLLYTSPSPRDRTRSRMPSSA